MVASSSYPVPLSGLVGREREQQRLGALLTAADDRPGAWSWLGVRRASARRPSSVLRHRGGS